MRPAVSVREALSHCLEEGSVFGTLSDLLVEEV
jgi:hypothetical protein